MTDFVIEFRPRTHHSPLSPPMKHTEEFVASFGSTRNNSPSNYLSPPPEVSSLDGSTTNSPMHLGHPSAYRPSSCFSPAESEKMSEKYSDEETLGMVSRKCLSKQDITRVLERSILELTEKLLYGRTFYKVEGVMTISLEGGEKPITLNVKKVYGDSLDMMCSVKMKHASLRGDSPSSVSSDEWLGEELSSEMYQRADVRPSLLSDSPVIYSPRTFVDDEQGQLTDQKSMLEERVDVNEVVCHRTVGSKIRHESVIDEMESVTTGLVSDAIVEKNVYKTEDLEDEPSLVIDMSADVTDVDCPMTDMEMTSVTPDAASDQQNTVTESEDDSTVPNSPAVNLSDDQDDSDMSSESRDTDGPIDPPGDSCASRDPSVVPRPRSLVATSTAGLECKQCHQYLPDPETVSKHACEHHNLFCCGFCYRTFTAKNNLKRHVRLHTGSRPYKCTQCFHNFARKDDLKGHVLRHNYMKPFRCCVCQKGYTDRSGVKNHMAREHGARVLHVCPQCGESFHSDDGFSAHTNSHPEMRQFSCQHCIFIGTNNLMTMKHSLVHTRKLFTCKPCNALFTDPFSYTSHLKKHKADHTFTSFICCFCDTPLTTYEQFNRHEYYHAHGKLFSCTGCNKQFKSKKSAQEHELCHKDGQDTESIVFDCDKENETNQAQGSIDKMSESDICQKVDLGNVSEIFSTNIVSHQDQTESSDDQLTQPCEGVLDLSMKKASKTSSNVTQLCQKKQMLTKGSISSPMLCGPTDYSAPRDGCASGSPVSGWITDTWTQQLPSFSTVESTVESLHRPVYKTHGASKTTHSPPQPTALPTVLRFEENCDSGQHALPHIPRCTQMKAVCKTASVNPLLPRSLSGNQCGKSQFRINPYKRNKMADLASKFLAARGPQSFMRKGRPVTKPFLAQLAQDNRVASQWQPAIPMENTGMLQAESMVRQATLDQVEKSQLPTFIKSEPLIETDSPNIPEADTCTHMMSSDMANVAKKYVSSTLNGVAQVCGQCKEEFSSFSELESHSVHVHKRFLCEHCGKSFTARPNRDRHVRYHTGERPYKCDLCDQAFFRGDDLKYHRTTRHPTAQPFVCNICSANFTWQKDLERHMKQCKCKA